MDGLESRFDDFPARAVDHHRNGADVGFARDQTQVSGHRFDAVQQRVVHVDVDDGGSALDLVARHFDGFFHFVFAHQASKLPRAGDVGAFADHEKVRVFSERQRQRARQSSQRFDVVRFVRRDALDGF